MSKVKICIVGLGRTGAEIAKVFIDNSNIELVAAFCRPDSEKENMDIGEVLGIKPLGRFIYSSNRMAEILAKLQPDIVVDFSTPKSTLEFVKIIGEQGINHIIGTTGFSKIELKRLVIYSKKYDNGILYAPNVTLGVNVMMLLSNIAANLLNNYDFQINETHHRYKKDSPSGTACKILDAVNSGLMNSGRKDINIPINAVRAGGVVGRHELMVVGDNDKIEIIHESFSRKAFADGVIRGVEFLLDRSGYYEMSDVLDIESVLESYISDKNKKKNKRKMRVYKDYKKLEAVNFI